MSDQITQIGFLAGATRFRRISEKLHVDGDKIYKDNNVDFKASWFSVFYILSISEEAKTVVELAEEIGFSHITVKNVVRELETNGLVTVVEHPKDGRSKHISISDAGKILLEKLRIIWNDFSLALKQVLHAGHPDFLNIINRIDHAIYKTPIHERAKLIGKDEPLLILDYKPSLKKYFYDLAGNWLLGVLNGVLEEEDQYTLHNPDKAYIEKGGFLFFAMYQNKPVGVVALKRLNEDTFEFAKLFIDPEARKLGIATKLIERCISRCKENNVKQLWLQTTMSMPQAHKLYYKLGFSDQMAPPQMDVLKRTEKIMVMEM
ncbi:GNAT family N-acetyltransferase [Dyadobacter subterraneus]|uniref:Bifunctional helix-turn-helix transcriptional regulator/GNAT family N-acetyltransferase n=1 Tax=Dyadobacter subterraneus TaxID=2773304 RepID=A0ABR9W8A4_9BACT|nr:bifunctional helix-turn-helix transcriptional regulator/GNAT family N-acetyltransferase [Dyadobacter subterraneus]MBE9461698.1 bifunctional helix-turn-helix transcriptional regulator/GNAT family N-acetyltransferase [Dyadobacter subterraneus]